MITTLVAVIAVFSTSVAPASAAGPRTVSAAETGVALLQPTEAQKAEALQRLEQSRSADPAGFAERLRIIKGSKPLTTFLASDSRFDSGLQQRFLAASMPTDVLEALVELTDTGYLTLEVKDGPNGTKVAKLSKAKPSMVGGGKGGMSMKPMFPQCPSAWAALWAWWGTNAAFCGAMGFFGPMAALGCSAAMAIAGSVIDFNRGC
ncbi:hypothetical protein [Arthrobacter sp. CJ23]|uniref:hypothetical protein n=1 Tax=Arthrobacter sp. CJ23 TaxID=2972479 RepID=UPI00215C9E02|nr:hypothetical protein [Arthrobacter sp. CJ23]UVJ39668.1 hypothetical protein NVV90_00230 [Arthrobacter sp. CJ23]